MPAAHKKIQKRVDICFLSSFVILSIFSWYQLKSLETRSILGSKVGGKTDRKIFYNVTVNDIGPLDHWLCCCDGSVVSPLTEVLVVAQLSSAQWWSWWWSVSRLADCLAWPGSLLAPGAFQNLVLVFTFAEEISEIRTQNWSRLALSQGFVLSERPGELWGNTVT